MSTFYLLPPRAWLGRRLADSLGLRLPELETAGVFWAELADALGNAAGTEAYVVYREELPADEDPARALMDGFGAEPGDEVVEVRPGEVEARRWRLPTAEGSAGAG
jgi:hypothetical protein